MKPICALPFGMGDVAQEEETETEHFGDQIQIDQVVELL